MVGRLVAVLERAHPTFVKVQHFERYATIQYRKDAFNETSLADRVAKLEEQGYDASISRAALVSLRVAKGSAPSNGYSTYCILRLRQSISEAA